MHEDLGFVSRFTRTLLTPMVRPLLTIFAFFVLYSLPTAVSAQQAAGDYSLFLLGDCGEPYVAASPMGKVLRREVTAAGQAAKVLYMGDNIYPRGLSNEGDRDRVRGEKILQTQADWIKGLGVQGIFIPGNHDWQRGKRNGLTFIHNQQAFLDSLHDSNIGLLPQDGCPGPVEIPLSDNAVLVIIDTQWLLHPWDKPGEESSCDAKTPAVLLGLIGDVFRRHPAKRIILAGHHPLITYGEHGGVFRAKDHLFPLTDLNRKLYIPLPVVGSIYPLYRTWFGDIQDTPHPIYKEYSRLLQGILKEFPGSVYAAGHDHALQYIVKDETHHIVSGGGSKSSFVKKKKYSRYAGSVTGFVKLTVHANGTATIAYWQVDSEFPEGRVAYTEELSALKRPEAPSTTAANGDFTGKFVRVKASEQYSASKSRAKLLGQNYRDEWGQEIDVPVFDIGKEHGGMKIVQRGGGQQTLSLRMQDSSGHEYVLRSVEKYPEKAVPEMFRKTFAQDLVQDQISASHPYAATVIPTMAEAAGIYHTNPRIVYIPEDPRFGIYTSTFANTLAVFEERPADDWSEESFFGNSKKIISTSKVLEKLAKDNDNQVDQEFVVRSRIFDMLIGDWDRHDDQWRWASFKTKKGESYRPIPRDRDQAFFVNEGMLPKVWSRRWALPKFEGFDERINWAPGLEFNARYFDRSFLTGVSEETWANTARDIQNRVTDEVIEHAIKSWPPEIYKLHGEEIIRKLKARRARLVDDALEHYRFLAREVDILGSNKNEFFDVERLSNGDVSVRVSAMAKDGDTKKKFYDRVFKRGETNEIRLYGQGGQDKFNVHGTSNRSILVRIIGGEGQDTLTDASQVAGIRKKTLFYDLKKDYTITSSTETGDRTSGSPTVNHYDRMSFKYDRLVPLVYGNFNPDDGVFFGGGFLFQKEGFRKTPFKQRHVLLVSAAPRTSSYNFLYRGDFTNVIGKWGLEVNADIKSPNYVNNFFGMGNESVFDKDITQKPGRTASSAINYYRFRFEEQRYEAYLTRRLGNWTTFKFGPALQRVELEYPGDKDRYITQYLAENPGEEFEEYNTYLGASWNFTVDKRNSRTLTTQGILWSVWGRNMAATDTYSHDFSSYETALSLYHTFRFPARVSFAARIGGGMTTGNYEFYQAQILSGRTELRGYRKTRFYGDKKLYSNLEMRIKLLSLRTYLFPASLGVLGFHDFGRVWYEGEKSSQWHRGWGGGVWITPFNMTVLSVEVAGSEESTLGYVRLGFLF